MKILFWPHKGQNAPWKSVPSTKFTVINCYTDLSCMLRCGCVFDQPVYQPSRFWQWKKTKLTFEYKLCTLILLFRLSICRRAHTLTVLFILTCALVYVTLLEETPHDTAYNTKRYGRHAVGVSFNFSTGTRTRFRVPENETPPEDKVKVAWCGQKCHMAVAGRGLASVWDSIG